MQITTLQKIMSSSNIISEDSFDSKSDEINFSFILNSLLRRKRLLTSITTISFLISIIFYLITKKTWQGQFQIVLTPNIDKIANQFDQIGISSFESFGGNSSLRTEVGILESPSVLIPIYEFAKKETKKLNPKSGELTFYQWKDKLNIQLKKSTKILEITYDSKNKELIIPVLKEISEAYQDYSGKAKKRTIELTKKYLIDQVAIYKIKSSNSIKKAQKFAISQDLKDNSVYRSGIDFAQNIESESAEINKLPTNFGIQNVEIENIRINAANKIRVIQEQIDNINNLKDDTSELIFYGSKIPALEQEGLPQRLKNNQDRLLEIKRLKKNIKEIDKNNIEDIQYIISRVPRLAERYTANDLLQVEFNLAKLREQYKEEDETVIKKLYNRNYTINYLLKNAIKFIESEESRLIENKKPLIDILKRRAIGYLKAEKLITEARMKSAIRPDGVILKYKELMREAARDETTLVQLENQLRKLKLEEAKYEDPWKLITKPTLIDYPISPSLKINAFLGLIFGLFISYVLILYLDKKTDLVFETKIIEYFFKSPILIQPIDSNSEEKNFDKTIIQQILKHNGKTNFILTAKLRENDIENFKNIIKPLTFDNSINIIKENFVDMTETDKTFLLIDMEKITYKEVRNLKNRINIFNIKLSGIFIT